MKLCKWGHTERGASGDCLPCRRGRRSDYMDGYGLCGFLHPWTNSGTKPKSRECYACVTLGLVTAVAYLSRSEEDRRPRERICRCDRPGRKVRGVCMPCYDRARHHGTLHLLGPRNGYWWDEYLFMRENTNDTDKQIAARLGIRLDTLRAAQRRKASK